MKRERRAHRHDWWMSLGMRGAVASMSGIRNRARQLSRWSARGVAGGRCVPVTDGRIGTVVSGGVVSGTGGSARYSTALTRVHTAG